MLPAGALAAPSAAQSAHWEPKVLPPAIRESDEAVTAGSGSPDVSVGSNAEERWLGSSLKSGGWRRSAVVRIEPEERGVEERCGG